MKLLQEKTLLMKYIEIEQGKSIEDILHQKYIEEEKPIRLIGEELGVHYHTVNKWLKDMEINARLPHTKLLDLVEIKRKLKEKENEK